MANTFIKVGKIVEAAALLLQRELVLARTVWRQADADFVGSLNDTITLRIPAARTAQRRDLRSTGAALQAVELTETSVAVQLTDHVYDLLKVTDEQLTLDVRDFTSQILQPQMSGVAEGIEDVIVEALQDATAYAGEIDGDEYSDGYDLAVDARKMLNDLNVPRGNRFLVLGSALESMFLKTDRLSKVNEAGTDSALRDAMIDRVAGFTVLGSNALGEYEGYAYHQTGVALGIVAPALPDGAPHKARVSIDNIALRFLRDYAPENSTGPVDRTLVDAFVGAVAVEQGSVAKRIVKINGDGVSSS